MVNREGKAGTVAAGVLARTALAAVLTAACAHQAEPIRIVRDQVARGVRLSLVAAPGARINARLKPAFELVDGTVRRFDSPAVTPDSAYFTAPPELVLPSGQSPEGVVRASVCPAGESVCRMVTVHMRGRE
jgi:hypothetical protein